MQIEQPQIETRKLGELSNWEKNPKTVTSDDFDRLIEQIKRLKMYKPLLINEENIVLGGNARLHALRKLNVPKDSEIMVSVVETNGDEALMTEYALSDNDQIGRYDDQAVAELVANLPELHLKDYKVDIAKPKSLDHILRQFGPDSTEEDTPPDVPEEPKAKPGELYQLGDHRILCGDATDPKASELLMDGKLADLIVTDPPYNVDYEGSAGKIENDSFKNHEEFCLFLKESMLNYHLCSKPGASIYVFHADSEGLAFRQAFIDAGFLHKQTCIWVKNNLVMGRQDYQWQHEPVLYGWKAKGTHAWYADRKQTTLWNFDRPTKSKEHPTMKPVKLCAYPIENSSKSGDIVLDFFLGSSSTLIAAEQTGRICYGMEIDPKFIDVGIVRWQNLTGKEAMRIEDDGKLTPWNEI